MDSNSGVDLLLKAFDSMRSTEKDVREQVKRGHSHRRSSTSDKQRKTRTTPTLCLGSTKTHRNRHLTV